MAKNDVPVTPECLLKGAIYALEQCGLLLHDAATLYNGGSYATAAVLALYAREELGRYEKLREVQERSVERKGSVTVKYVKHLFKDHERKQEWGQVSTVLRTSGGDRLAELFATINRRPGTKEWKRAYKEWEEMEKRQRKQTPWQRHENRMRALYVDLNEAGSDWRLPRQQPKEEATLALNDAIRDYALVRHNLELDSLRHRNPEFAYALEAWADRPQLPRWPDPVT